jgi:hypothetical protein
MDDESNNFNSGILGGLFWFWICLEVNKFIELEKDTRIVSL